MNLYLDIETIPTRLNSLRMNIADTVKPPGNMSKPETIAEWASEKKPRLVEDAIAQTALDGAYGSICCIGWAIDDGNASCSFGDDEQKVIKDFVTTLDAEVTARRHVGPMVVGHNVVNFDIRFLWQRAIILGIRMPRWFPRDPKPWGHDVFDTMTAFAGARGSIGMAKLCDALGLEGKGDIDGSMVGQLWATGQRDRVAAYCRGDVERTRAIHKRMQVAFGEVA